MNRSLLRIVACSLVPAVLFADPSWALGTRDLLRAPISITPRNSLQDTVLSQAIVEQLVSGFRLLHGSAQTEAPSILVIQYAAGRQRARLNRARLHRTAHAAIFIGVAAALLSGTPLFSQSDTTPALQSRPTTEFPIPQPGSLKQHMQETKAIAASSDRDYWDQGIPLPAQIDQLEDFVPVLIDRNPGINASFLQGESSVELYDAAGSAEKTITYGSDNNREPQLPLGKGFGSLNSDTMSTVLFQRFNNENSFQRVESASSSGTPQPGGFWQKFLGLGKGAYDLFLNGGIQINSKVTIQKHILQLAKAKTEVRINFADTEDVEQKAIRDFQTKLYTLMGVHHAIRGIELETRITEKRKAHLSSPLIFNTPAGQLKAAEYAKSIKSLKDQKTALKKQRDNLRDDLRRQLSRHSNDFTQVTLNDPRPPAFRISKELLLRLARLKLPNDDPDQAEVVLPNEIQLKKALEMRFKELKTSRVLISKESWRRLEQTSVFDPAFVYLILNEAWPVAKYPALLDAPPVSENPRRPFDVDGLFDILPANDSQLGVSPHEASLRFQQEAMKESAALLVNSKRSSLAFAFRLNISAVLPILPELKGTRVIDATMIEHQIASDNILLQQYPHLIDDYRINNQLAQWLIYRNDQLAALRNLRTDAIYILSKLDELQKQLNPTTADTDFSEPAEEIAEKEEAMAADYTILIRAKDEAHLLTSSGESEMSQALATHYTATMAAIDLLAPPSKIPELTIPLDTPQAPDQKTPSKKQKKNKNKDQSSLPLGRVGALAALILFSPPKIFAATLLPAMATTGLHYATNWLLQGLVASAIGVLMMGYSRRSTPIFRSDGSRKNWAVLNWIVYLGGSIGLAVALSPALGWLAHEISHLTVTDLNYWTHPIAQLLTAAMIGLAMVIHSVKRSSRMTNGSADDRKWSTPSLVGYTLGGLLIAVAALPGVWWVGIPLGVLAITLAVAYPYVTHTFDIFSLPYDGIHFLHYRTKWRSLLLGISRVWLLTTLAVMLWPPFIHWAHRQGKAFKSSSDEAPMSARVSMRPIRVNEMPKEAGNVVDASKLRAHTTVNAGDWILAMASPNDAPMRERLLSINSQLESLGVPRILHIDELETGSEYPKSRYQMALVKVMSKAEMSSIDGQLETIVKQFAAAMTLAQQEGESGQQMESHGQSGPERVRKIELTTLSGLASALLAERPMRDIQATKTFQWTPAIEQLGNNTPISDTQSLLLGQQLLPDYPEVSVIFTPEQAATFEAFMHSPQGLMVIEDPQQPGRTIHLRSTDVKKVGESVGAATFFGHLYENLDSGVRPSLRLTLQIHLPDGQQLPPGINDLHIKNYAGVASQTIPKDAKLGVATLIPDQRTQLNHPGPMAILRESAESIRAAIKTLENLKDESENERRINRGTGLVGAETTKNEKATLREISDRQGTLQALLDGVEAQIQALENAGVPASSELSKSHSPIVVGRVFQVNAVDADANPIAYNFPGAYASDPAHDPEVVQMLGHSIRVQVTVEANDFHDLKIGAGDSLWMTVPGTHQTIPVSFVRASQRTESDLPAGNFILEVDIPVNPQDGHSENFLNALIPQIASRQSPVGETIVYIFKSAPTPSTEKPQAEAAPETPPSTAKEPVLAESPKAPLGSRAWRMVSRPFAMILLPTLLAPYFSSEPRTLLALLAMALLGFVTFSWIKKGTFAWSGRRGTTNFLLSGLGITLVSGLQSLMIARLSLGLYGIMAGILLIRFVVRSFIAPRITKLPIPWFHKKFESIPARSPIIVTNPKIFDANGLPDGRSRFRTAIGGEELNGGSLVSSRAMGTLEENWATWEEEYAVSNAIIAAVDSITDVKNVLDPMALGMHAAVPQPASQKTPVGYETALRNALKTALIDRFRQTKLAFADTQRGDTLLFTLHYDHSDKRLFVMDRTLKHTLVDPLLDETRTDAQREAAGLELLAVFYYGLSSQNPLTLETGKSAHLEMTGLENVRRKNFWNGMDRFFDYVDDRLKALSEPTLTHVLAARLLDRSEQTPATRISTSRFALPLGSESMKRLRDYLRQSRMPEEAHSDEEALFNRFRFADVSPSMAFAIAKQYHITTVVKNWSNGRVTFIGMSLLLWLVAFIAWAIKPETFMQTYLGLQLSNPTMAVFQTYSSDLSVLVAILWFTFFGAMFKIITETTAGSTFHLRMFTLRWWGKPSRLLKDFTELTSKDAFQFLEQWNARELMIDHAENPGFEDFQSLFGGYAGMMVEQVYESLDRDTTPTTMRQLAANAIRSYVENPLHPQDPSFFNNLRPTPLPTDEQIFAQLLTDKTHPKVRLQKEEIAKIQSLRSPDQAALLKQIESDFGRDLPTAAQMKRFSAQDQWHLLTALYREGFNLEDDKARRDVMEARRVDLTLAWMRDEHNSTTAFLALLSRNQLGYAFDPRSSLRISDPEKLDQMKSVYLDLLERIPTMAPDLFMSYRKYLRIEKMGWPIYYVQEAVKSGDPELAKFMYETFLPSNPLREFDGLDPSVRQLNTDPEIAKKLELMDRFLAWVDQGWGRWDPLAFAARRLRRWRGLVEFLKRSWPFNVIREKPDPEELLSLLLFLKDSNPVYLDLSVTVLDKMLRVMLFEQGVTDVDALLKTPAFSIYRILSEKNIKKKIDLKETLTRYIEARDTLPEADRLAVVREFLTTLHLPEGLTNALAFKAPRVLSKSQADEFETFSRQLGGRMNFEDPTLYPAYLGMSILQSVDFKPSTTYAALLDVEAEGSKALKSLIKQSTDYGMPLFGGITIIKEGALGLNLRQTTLEMQDDVRATTGDVISMSVNRHGLSGYTKELFNRIVTRVPEEFVGRLHAIFYKQGKDYLQETTEGQGVIYLSPELMSMRRLGYKHVFPIFARVGVPNPFFTSAAEVLFWWYRMEKERNAFLQAAYNAGGEDAVRAVKWEIARLTFVVRSAGIDITFPDFVPEENQLRTNELWMTPNPSHHGLDEAA